MKQALSWTTGVPLWITKCCFYSLPSQGSFPGLRMLRNEQVQRGRVFVDTVGKFLIIVQLFGCWCGCSRELQPLFGVKVNCEWSEKQLPTGLLTFGGVVGPQKFPNGYISAVQFNCFRSSVRMAEEIFGIWTIEKSYRMSIREMFFAPVMNFAEVLDYHVGWGRGTGGVVSGAVILGRSWIAWTISFQELVEDIKRTKKLYLGVGDVMIEAPLLRRRQQEQRLWRVGIGTPLSKLHPARHGVSSCS
jgi:hypothetical protein